ncbi:uncharacterized protein EI97DRAFT_462518 [Westerdykella ornata]|uniref:Uncharacterized protein n=1 Tax=Westerdykella ornata TaxID=318751 RepID=A0A6A6J6J6_WESOR|nr:uncharacterized protein EI97DRAFT_462518 [Westerdykella ornata]KAF2271827.1 hypothetical protein EI97DRAFT_462518 [Westerdykella ornata]
MDTSARPQVRVIGASRNPEYNINSGTKRFARREDGGRIAPVSQLNTYTGRALANCAPSQPPQGNAFSRRSDPPPQGRQARPAGDVPKGKPMLNRGVSNKISDRERLPSQRPRTELSQLLGMTRGSSRKGTTQGRSSSGIGPPPSAACSKCERWGTVDFLRPSSDESQVCNSCHRFLPGPQLTALDGASGRPRQTGMDPVPPSKYPTGLICATCVSIPGYLYQEYLQFFPKCPCCGHMTDMTLSDLIANEREVNGLRDENGKRVSGASKELQDWCVYIAHHARSVSRHNSGRSVASSISSLGLRRSGAIRRTPTASTGSSVGGTSHPGLIPASQMDVSKPRYTRRFSFTTIGPPTPTDKGKSSTVRALQPPVPEPGLPFQSRKYDSSASSLRTSSAADMGFGISRCYSTSDA